MLENTPSGSQNLPEKPAQNAEYQPKLELDLVNAASLGLLRLSPNIIDTLSACATEEPDDMRLLSDVFDIIDGFLESDIKVVTTHPRTPTSNDPPFLPGEHRGIFAKITNAQGYDAYINLYGGLRDSRSAADLHDNLVAHYGSRHHTSRTDNILSKETYFNVQVLDPKRRYLVNVDLRHQLGNNFRVTKADLYPRTSMYKYLESGILVPFNNQCFSELETELKSHTSVLTSQVLSAL